MLTHENLQISTVHYPNPETFSRAECAQNPVRYFAILSMQRSGSGWFETLLNSHVNTLDKVYNLDWFTSASKNECSAAVGFKWMLNQGVMQHHKESSRLLQPAGVSSCNISVSKKSTTGRMVSDSCGIPL
ncbi:hypothetical protein NC652_018813 [Populus alba x Populus x berolinensis]|nr:hypothetical protein NC652_018813 [Populus alba x Populus x berolinensis]